MPLVGSSRKHVSELIKGYEQFEKEAGTNFNFARVTVYAASNTDVDPIGAPIIWDATNDRFELLANGDTIPAEATDLPGDFPVCVSVGAKEGIGFNREDVTILTTGTELTVLFRGQAAINRSAIDYPVGVLAATQGVFENQLEKQFIAVQDTATKSAGFYVAE